jgi:hypothetical protein
MGFSADGAKNGTFLWFTFHCAWLTKMLNRQDIQPVREDLLAPFLFVYMY